MCYLATNSEINKTFTIFEVELYLGLKLEVAKAKIRQQYSSTKWRADIRHALILLMSDKFHVGTLSVPLHECKVTICLPGI